MPMNAPAMSVETRTRWMAARVTHGSYINGGERPEHYIWRGMIERCKFQDKHYAGVRVCRHWQKYENFLADMGPRPSPKHSLDRYPDPFGDYEPKNCRWATPSQQIKNKRRTPHYVSDGKIGTVGDWAARLKISTPLARWRWKCWGTFEKGKAWKCVPPKELRKARLINISLA